MPKAMNLPPNVEVRRSNKRRRTVSAAREGNKTVLNVFFLFEYIKRYII
jgi:hypothetical protein